MQVASNASWNMNGPDCGVSCGRIRCLRWVIGVLPTGHPPVVTYPDSCEVLLFCSDLTGA
jgi:hypothetical protein